MSMRKICLLAAVLGTSVSVANADTSKLRRKIKLDGRGNFRINLNGKGNLSNLQDAVKDIMKGDEVEEVLGKFDGLIASIVGDAMDAVGGRRLSLEGRVHANGAQDRSIKFPGKEDKDRFDELDILDGELLDGDRDGNLFEGDLFEKEEEEEIVEEPLSHKEKRAAKRAERAETKSTRRADRKAVLDEIQRLDREGKKLDREQKKLDREERRVARKGSKEVTEVEEELHQGGMFHRSDRRLRGRFGNESEEARMSREVLVSLETLQIVLQEFDTLNVFHEKSDESRVATLLSNIREFVREKLDALALRREERKAARGVRIAERKDERTARIEAREDLEFEIKIIQKVKLMIEDFSVRDHDLLDFADRDEPLKVLPAFDGVTKSVLDFNDRARNGFLYEKSRISDKSLGRLSLQREKHFKLERAPKLKGNRFHKKDQEEEEEEEEEVLPPVEEEEPDVEEELEEKLAEEHFETVLTALGNLKKSLRKEKNWGLIREDLETIEEEIEDIERDASRRSNLRSRRNKD